MFDKLLQVQQKAEEVKKRLENISLTGEAEGGKIKVTANYSNRDRSNAFFVCR